MIHYIVYKTDGLTSTIIRQGTCSPECWEDIADSSAGELVFLGSCNAMTDYIGGNPPMVMPRPTQQTTLDKTLLMANGADAAIITGAPAGATLTVENLATGDTVSGALTGDDSVCTAIVGRYRIMVSAWPYLDWEAFIDAV